MNVARSTEEAERQARGEDISIDVEDEIEPISAEDVFEEGAPKHDDDDDDDASVGDSETKAKDASEDSADEATEETTDDADDDKDA